MKTALITGGSSGIGFALAGEFGRRGYRVALLARRADVLESNAALLAAQGYTALAVPCDVTDAAAVRSACDGVLRQWGSIDVAIANAGVGIPTPARKFVLADAAQVMTTNFYGMLYLYDAVIPGMLEQRSGTFAGIASLAGLRGLPGSSAYSASKAAMQAFLESVRVELAPHGVSVTIVNPGFVATPMTEKNRFRMPFLMTTEKAAGIIARGLDRHARQIEFPMPMSILMRAARLMPAFAYDGVFRLYGKRRIDARQVRR